MHGLATGHGPTGNLFDPDVTPKRSGKHSVHSSGTWRRYRGATAATNSGGESRHSRRPPPRTTSSKERDHEAAPLLAGLVPCLVCALTRTSQTQDPPAPADFPSLAVRLAYDRLSYFHAIAAVRAASEAGDSLDDGDKLSFEIADLRSGDIHEIEGTTFVDLVTPPSGDTVEWNTAVFPADGRESVLYSGRWVSGAAGPSPSGNSLRQVLVQAGSRYADVGKYTSYRVTIRARRSKLWRRPAGPGTSASASYRTASSWPRPST
jgi:hypothetical protein